MKQTPGKSAFILAVKTYIFVFKYYLGKTYFRWNSLHLKYIVSCTPAAFIEFLLCCYDIVLLLPAADIWALTHTSGLLGGLNVVGTGRLTVHQGGVTGFLSFDQCVWF